MTTCPICGAVIPDGQAHCPACGASPDDLPMRWHKALVYVILWLSMIGNFITGLRNLSSVGYTEAGVNFSGRIYGLFPALEVLDKCYGVACLALVALLLYTWFGLRGFKRGAWILPAVLHIVGAGISLVYAVGFLAIAGAAAYADGFLAILGAAEIANAIAGVIISLILSGAMAAVNYIYYKKREKYFVN